MLSRAAFRATQTPVVVARRGFQSTRAQFSSPYHYPEGPRSNLPFDPLKKSFVFKFWGYAGKLGPAQWKISLTDVATGFGLPFGLAGESLSSPFYILQQFLIASLSQSGKQRRTNRCDEIWSRKVIRGTVLRNQGDYKYKWKFSRTTVVHSNSAPISFKCPYAMHSQHAS
jgi:cytochrome c oxidase subunit 7c